MTTPCTLPPSTSPGQASPSGMVDELFAAIPHRHTNRLPYEDRPVPPRFSRR